MCHCSPDHREVEIAIAKDAQEPSRKAKGSSQASNEVGDPHARWMPRDCRHKASTRRGSHGLQQTHALISSEKQTKESGFTYKKSITNTDSAKNGSRDWDMLGELRQAAGTSTSATVRTKQTTWESGQDGEPDMGMDMDQIDTQQCSADDSRDIVPSSLLTDSVPAIGDASIDCLHENSCEAEGTNGTEGAVRQWSDHNHVEYKPPSSVADAPPRHDCILEDKDDGHETECVLLLADAAVSWLDSKEDVLSQWHAHFNEVNSTSSTAPEGSDHAPHKGSIAITAAASDACESWEDLWDDTLQQDLTTSPLKTPWYNRSLLLCARSEISMPTSPRSCAASVASFVATQRRPRHWIDPQKPRALPDSYFVPVRGITDENCALGHEHFSWNSWNVLEKPVWSFRSEIVNVKWRVYCIDVRKQPRVFQCGHSNTWNLHGSVGDWTQRDINPGILDINLAIQPGQDMQVHAVHGGDGHAITRVVLTDKFAFCMEHRKPETGICCFCPEAFAEAGMSGLVAACDVQEWGTVAEYIAGWRAPVELEAVHNAIEEGDSRYIFNVDIYWKPDGIGCIEIPVDLAISHKMKLRSSIACDEGYAEWGAGWFCLRRSSSNSGNWCGHGAIVSASVVHENDREQMLQPEVGEEDDLLTRLAAEAQQVRITFKLSVASSCAAPGVGLKRGYTVEFLPKTLPYSCMSWALVELTWCSQLVQDVVLRGRVDDSSVSYSRNVTRDHASRNDDWFSDLQSESKDLSGWSLNMSQCTAVHNALENPLSLIHGPPGTGKTKTASTLAALFSLQNVSDGIVAVVLYCAPSNDAADVACLRVGEVAAAHFKSVADIHPRMDSGDETCAICLGGNCDAITTCKHAFHQNCLEKALRISSKRCPVCRRVLHEPGGSVHMLRVYSAEIERNEFPVPKKIDHPSARPRKARHIPECMRAHALHWRCHGAAPGVIPTTEAVAAGIAYAKLVQTSSRDPGFGEARTDYLAALSIARAAELRQADIVFATCVTSRRGALAAALRDEGAPEILQVIVDEAGQSPEPETLCPLTLARSCRHAVLVGDPKQLQPIIKCSMSQRLGLNVSMLERLSNLPWGGPMSLNIQYRMHPSINAFPSAFFYNGALRTAESVLARPSGILESPGDGNQTALLFWKASTAQGEQLSHVKTADSNARSRFNPEEATRAASLARSLIAQVGSSEVAVLSWYNAQVAKISSLLQGTGVHVGSVVTSQGGEWDYVILSTVRGGSGSIGCLADEHLLDVALTRARFGVCVLGTPGALRQGSAAWSAFIDHCEKDRLVITDAPRLRRSPQPVLCRGVGPAF